MKISVNGQCREVPEGTTLSALINLLALKGDRIACERNLEVVPRPSYPETKLAEGDNLEIVTFVGGG
jgi:sulfur carrier protein